MARFGSSHSPARPPRAGSAIRGPRGFGSWDFLRAKPCVVWNATVFDECNGPSNDDEKLASIDDKRAFWLEDGSGDRAWIVPEGCSTRAQATQRGSFPGIRAGRGDLVPNVVTEMTPRVLEWTRQHYQPIGASHITVDETAIGPGDVVYVLGRAEREPGGRLRLAP